MAGKAPTIHDVARQAKVSTATVSRALSAPHRVSEAARERVSAAIDSTGFTINQAARALRLQAARTILIAFPNIGNPFYSTILDAVLAEASARGYGVLVANRLGDNPTQWLKEYFLSSRADGMVLFDGKLQTDELHGLKSPQGKFPLVVACDELPDPRLHAVLVDNREAARTATRHLIGLGHRRIGHIFRASVTPGFESDRRLGFIDAMQEAGLDIDPGWLIEGDFSLESGEAAARTVLGLARRPSAVFSANDEMAIGFISALREAGLECPRDVSVIGFDDIDLSRCLAPPLTTIRQPRAEIGRLATRALIDILENDNLAGEPIKLVLKTELMVRGSTAPIGKTA